jgi:hypothetical protein
MPTPRLRATALALALPLLALAACGDGDDGADVRNLSDDTSGSGSSSSGSGSSSSGAASGSSASEVACQPVGDPVDADTTIEVTLTEWSVDAPDSVAAGTIAIDAVNNGTEPHEVVIVQGDSYESLPRGEHGEVLEDELAEGALIGEIEAFPAGETCTGVFDLTPGTYVLICNIVEEEDGETVSHPAEGMVTTITVT